MRRAESPYRRLDELRQGRHVGRRCEAGGQGAISYQLSAISYQLSAISCDLQAASCELQAHAITRPQSPITRFSATPLPAQAVELLLLWAACLHGPGVRWEVDHP